MPKQNSARTVAVARDRPGGVLYRQGRLMVALGLMLCMGFTGVAAATSSNSYMITEPQFGNGTLLQNCSTSYCSQSSIGDTTVGQSQSGSYGAQTGTYTTDESLLEVTTGGGNQDLGSLTPDETSTLTMTVNVRSYITGGYVMQIAGASPSQGTHQLTKLSTPTASQPGVEQFGINLVANSTPAVGADPVQVPSSETSFGTVDSNYNVADLFMYEEGSIVAGSTRDSGETDYTISMIFNISNLTPSGRYTGAFSAVVVALY